MVLSALILSSIGRLERRPLKAVPSAHEVVIPPIPSAVSVKVCGVKDSIKSPEDIETTPGAYAYLCSLFGENNINIVETLSCWTDTIFLIKEEDAGKVINLMKF